MESHTIRLNEAQAKFVHDCIETGSFADVGDVLTHALTLLQKAHANSPDEVEYIRGELQKAYDARERGEYTDLRTDDDFAALSEAVRRQGREWLESEHHAAQRKAQ